MNFAPVDRSYANPNNHLFSKKAYGEGHGLVTGSEEVTAIGPEVGTDPIVKTDNGINVKVITIPGWFCSVICAGLNMDELISGQSNIESPENLAKKEGEASAGPPGSPSAAAAGAGVEAVLDALAKSDKNLMSSEEQLLIDKGRYGVDPSLSKPGSGVSNPDNKNKNYLGEFICENTLPDVNECMNMGSELAKWFSERILNTEIMCNFDAGDCGDIMAY
mmetsp:Transcript_19450/g.15997  ORF Transcript_19450/g.15997 Transcript_19450/m.15997 type:complete len:219 (+) Transcript_19450:700-1356(+)